MGQGGQFNLVTRGPLGNKSGVVAVADTWQKLLSASDNWNWILIQNQSTQIERLLIYFGDLATPPTDDQVIEILPGDEIKFASPGFVSNQQINVKAVTINHPFVCWAA